MIYSKKCIDYSKGVTIIDLITNKTYTHEEALKQPDDVKHRLVCRPNKMGCYVYDLDEIEIVRKRRLL